MNVTRNKLLMNDKIKFDHYYCINSTKTLQNDDQRTNGPVNAHLISWPSKAQNIQNLENIWYRNDLDLLYSHTFIISISCFQVTGCNSF